MLHLVNCCVLFGVESCPVKEYPLHSGLESLAGVADCEGNLGYTEDKYNYGYFWNITQSQNLSWRYHTDSQTGRYQKPAVNYNKNVTNGERALICKSIKHVSLQHVLTGKQNASFVYLDIVILRIIRNASCNCSKRRPGFVFSYGGGGYVQYLGSSFNESLNILEDLQSKNWIDLRYVYGMCSLIMFLTIYSIS